MLSSARLFWTDEGVHPANVTSIDRRGHESLRWLYHPPRIAIQKKFQEGLNWQSDRINCSCLMGSPQGGGHAFDRIRVSTERFLLLPSTLRWPTSSLVGNGCGSWHGKVEWCGHSVSARSHSVFCHGHSVSAPDGKVEWCDHSTSARDHSTSAPRHSASWRNHSASAPDHSASWRGQSTSAPGHSAGFSRQICAAA